MSTDNDDDAVASSVFGSVYALMRLVEEAEEDDDEEEKARWGGSTPFKRKNVARDFEGAYNKLVEQYFSGPASVYDKKSFERRFGEPRQVVERLIQEVMGCGPFIQKVDLFTKRPGIRTLVQFAACMHMLVYGNCADMLDEYLQILEPAVNKSLKHFFRLCH